MLLGIPVWSVSGSQYNLNGRRIAGSLGRTPNPAVIRIWCLMHAGYSLTANCGDVRLSHKESDWGDVLMFNQALGTSSIVLFVLLRFCTTSVFPLVRNRTLKFKVSCNLGFKKRQHRPVSKRNQKPYLSRTPSTHLLEKEFREGHGGTRSRFLN